MDIDEAATLTVKELRDAVVRVLPQEFDDMDDTSALVLANDILRNVQDYREREWRAYDVVRDVTGKIWQRSGSGANWHAMGKTGVYSHSRPTRPLELIDSPADRKDMARRLAALEAARDDGAPI